MTYPFTPGVKGSLDTGHDGAAMIAPKLGARQAEVLADLEKHGPSTAEEIAERTNRHWFHVRPRISELRTMGLVVDTGERFETGLGGKTHQVRLTTPEERAGRQENAEAA